MFTNINNNKSKKIGSLATIHVKKWHNTKLWHITEVLSITIKDFFWTMHNS